MRKGVKYQSVALVMGLLISFVFVSLSQAEEVKESITNALAKGDTTVAINLLNSEIEIDPSYHYNYYVLGEIYFERTQYEKAEEQFRKALDSKSKHYDSMYMLGITLIELEKYDEALALMDTGRKKDKDQKARFEDGYGLVMLKKKNYSDADRSFRSALSDKDLPLYHIHLGDANFYQGIPSLAITEYEKALELDTASLEVYYHWAEACLEMKDFPCAIEKLKVVLTKDSTFAPAWNRAAGIYYKAARSTRDRDERKARFMDAIGAYKKYIELSHLKPDSATVRPYFEIAMAYSEIYGFEDAAKYFEQVLAIPMEPRDIYFYYGKALWGTKQYEKAGEMLLKHIDWVAQQNNDYKSRIDEDELYQLLGDSYYYRENKDFFTAIEYYKKSLEIKPEQKRLLQNVAVAYHTQKSYEQALEYYDKRIELGIDEKSASMLKNAGYCALNLANSGGGEEDDMIEEGMEDVASAPIDPIAYYERANGYMLQYLEYVPSDSKILLAVANTYLYQMKDCANGVKYFEQLAALEPNNCDAQKSLGYAYFGGVCTKNYSKALGYLNKAYECSMAASNACGDVSLTLWIAQCYHLRAAEKAAAKQDANDDFRDAYNWYGKVLKCEPGHAEATKGQADTRFEFVE